MSSYKKKDIPDRWLDYSAVGQRLDGTRFIAFKVPLKQALTQKLRCSEVFGPWDLLDRLSKPNQELGLIIDLTFTTRYYQLQDVPQSLLFVKIFTAGHDVPSDQTILSFKRAVHRFLRDNRDNDKLIGVHCTHGVNRTGYLICRYLIDVDGMDPEKAVKLFNSSRGHAIERQNYLKDLKHGPRRSNVGIEELEQEPVRGQASGRESSNDPKYLRSYPPERSNFQPPHRGFFTQSPLLHSPPRRPVSSSHYQSYRWTPTHPDSQYRRPPRSADSWSRHPQNSAHEDRRRLPRYPDQWTSLPDDEEAAQDWGWHKPRTSDWHTGRHRTNRYDDY
ncbi:RNA/RNP complex-1-interacting phosphatase [Nothobranchius furzeri]|uniref:RNA/RNP complex-1-interacting phosphatase n=1 Tax=Nothobranchius furzeri TaxID=105023 RepID=A0A1A8UFX8_NOTFU|nr:RNA/RNP complex-1-interacting phosphatase [Nothobranchius furzeri]KAF7216740.1 RNA/RNP complex-1-interacting phosphatase-like [Nothobranchius furzeri]